MSNSNNLCVVDRDVSTFDKLELNADGKLSYDDGELTAVYPADADEMSYVVASFAIEDGEAEVPDGAVVLAADDRLHCLVPAGEYGGGSE
jgi:hypothetical protein